VEQAEALSIADLFRQATWLLLGSFVTCRLAKTAVHSGALIIGEGPIQQ
jgi:hypothetical protein